MTVQTTSAPRTASSTVSTARASGHSAARRSALSRERAAIRMSSNWRGLEHRRDVRMGLVAGADDREHRASSRASTRVATPETAAVRIAVIGLAFITASTSPVSPSYSVTVPWCGSSPRAGLSGKIATVFSAYSGRSPAR